MTQEEKAKRYDEVLKRAKQLLETPVAYDRFTIEKIFHELKESEDERIRKEIIEFLQLPLPLFVCKQNYEKWVAWLEKQGEIDKESYEIDEKEKREFVGDGFIKCYGNFQDFKEGETYWLEYVGNDNYNVRSDNLLGKTYHITPCQLYTIFKKMTWLEKQGDKKVLFSDDVCEWLRHHASVYVNSEYNEFHHAVEYDGTIDVDRLIKDLKSEFEKQGEQKQEWSEEPVSEDLEEAIKEHTEKERLRKAELESPFFMPTDFVSGFKAGAKWQEEREKEKK